MKVDLSVSYTEESRGFDVFDLVYYEGGEGAEDLMVLFETIHCSN